MSSSRPFAVVVAVCALAVACSSSSAGDPGSSSGDPPGSSSGDAPPDTTSSSSSGSVDAGGSSGTASSSSGDAGLPPSATNGVKDGDETDVDCGGSIAPACAPGAACAAATDCTSQICDAKVCTAPSSTDTVKNGDETDVDCGGTTAPRCLTDAACLASTDCADGVCHDDACAAPAYDDDVKNGDETGIDCGGGAPEACEPGQGCADADDCLQKICSDSTCIAATADDDVKNGDETDVDCGGTSGIGCAQDQICLVPGDCAEGVCNGGHCAAPTFSDVVKNGHETDVDCGGPDATAAQRCDAGKACVSDQGARDCLSQVCSNQLCQAPTFTDTVKNGNETDVDCGGEGATAAQRCGAGKACVQATRDCTDKVCTAGQCVAATFKDGVQNGTETDVDCGGAAATPIQRCVLDKACSIGARDCRSGGCLGNVCVPHSCAAGAGNGIDTCGLGGAGGRGEKAWESCCARAPVTVPEQGNASISLSKYPVTAGRMRQFLEAVGYDVRTYVRQARTDGLMPKIPASSAFGPPKSAPYNIPNSSDNLVLESAWDMYLPVSLAGKAEGELTDYPQNGNASTAYAGIYSSIKNHLGGSIFRDNYQGQTGCYTGGGTHSFLFPDSIQDTTPGYDQTVYDPKAMQCSTYLVAQAFCVWDGGRLETTAEWNAAWGPAVRPWNATDTRDARAITSSSYEGCRFPTATDATISASCPGSASSSIELADYMFSYQYPASLINSDYIVFISAPGRTRGRGPSGHSDLLGLNFEATSDVEYNANPLAARHHWTNPGSWEVHGYGKSVIGWSDKTHLLNKYGKLGLRCAYPALPTP